MLFAVNYTNQPHRDEALDKRIVKLLAAWKPPAGFEMKSWYDYADGTGGIAIVDVPSAEVLLEAVGPWSTFSTFSVKPLVSIEASTPLFEKGIAWRDSVK
jgi:hypothetical protein